MKKVKVYAYKVDCKKDQNFPNDFCQKFEFNNIASNVDEGEPYSVVMILNQPNEGAIDGRLLKLRGDAPMVISLVNKVEKHIELNEQEKERIEEITHFVWFYNDNIILAEYNHFAFRIFSNQLNEYVRKKLGLKEEEFNVTPITIEKDKLLRVIMNAASIYSIELRLSNDALEELDKRDIFSIAGVLSRLTQGEESVTISLSLKVKKGRDRSLNLGYAKDIIMSLHRSDSLKSLKVGTDSGIYELVQNAFKSVELEIEQRGRTIDKDDFYRKVRNHFMSNKGMYV